MYLFSILLQLMIILNVSKCGYSSIFVDGDITDLLKLPQFFLFRKCKIMNDGIHTEHFSLQTNLLF